MAYWAHESAVIDREVVIGEGTKIWHFSHVSSGARIGRDCVLGQNVYVARTAVIGDRVRIQNNVSIYDGVVIDDDAFIGPSAVFTNVINPRSEVSRKGEYLPTRVGAGVTIGANATIVCGQTLGKYAFVGAGAVVTHDVRPFTLVVGVPAREVGWVCRCGERLEGVGLGNEGCRACGRAYRLESNGLHEA
jgi:UDP-2-acetamido-3-amino-2,3-dideoxy-glucuronate N-acetyltransferase